MSGREGLVWGSKEGTGSGPVVFVRSRLFFSSSAEFEPLAVW